MDEAFDDWADFWMSLMTVDEGIVGIFWRARVIFSCHNRQ